jgi:hypothetical protein
VHLYSFQLDVVCNQPSDQKVIQNFVESEFKDAKLIEHQERKLSYLLPKTHKISDIFAVMEKSSSGQLDMHLQYSVSQISLEQIFIRFANTSHRSQKTNAESEGVVAIEMQPLQIAQP